MRSEVRRNVSIMCTFETRIEASEKESTNYALRASENRNKVTPEHFSRWVRLVRVQARMNRFLSEEQSIEARCAN